MTNQNGVGPVRVEFAPRFIGDREFVERSPAGKNEGMISYHRSKLATAKRIAGLPGSGRREVATVGTRVMILSMGTSHLVHRPS